MTDTSLEIKIDSSDAKNAARDLDSLAVAGNKTEKSITELGKSTDKAAQQFASFASGFIGISAALASAKSILDTNVQMERLRAALTSTMGSIEAGRDSFKFIQDFATKTPYEVKGLTETFVMLKNMGLEPTQKVMEAMTNQASKLGGSQEVLTSIALQLGQAYSKGKLQQEDMIILAQRGVPIYDLLAKVTGKNTDELMDMSAKGTITRDVIGQLIDKMGEMSSGANATAMDTLGGKLSNLADEITRAKDAMIESRGEHFLGILIEDWTYAVQGFREFIADKNPFDELNAKIESVKSKVGQSRTRAGVDPAQLELIGLENQRAAMMAEELKRNEIKKTADIIKETEDWYQESAKKTVAVKKEHTRVSHGLSEAQKQEAKAEQEIARQEERYKAMREGANADVAFIANIREYTDAYNKGAISLQDYVYWLQKLDGERNQSKGTKSSDNGWNTITQIQDEVTAERKKNMDTYTSSVDNASNSIQDLGRISSAVFGVQAGGIQLLAAAFGDLASSLDNIAKKEADIAKKREENAKEQDPVLKEKKEKDYTKQAIQLNDQKVQAAIGGMARITEATSQMFDKEGNARRALHSLSIALSAIEMAMQLKKIALDITEAIVNQGKGDPYSAFARIAAMAAVMATIAAGVGLAVGAMQGNGPGATPESPSTGTVLGDSTKTSDSINNVAGILKDIHSKEYRELKGINKGIENLQTGITSFVTKLFQAGGFKTPNITLPAAALSGIGSMISKGADIIGLVRKMPIIGGIMGGIDDFIMGGLFGKTTSKITGGGIYAGGNKLTSVLNGGQISAQQYTEITETTKSWFSKSTSVREILSPISADVKSGLTKIFKGMGESMVSMSNAFGKDMSDNINNYVIPKLKVSLKGLTSDQMIKKLDGVLSTQMDKMTTKIFGSLIDQYQKLGEGMFETASRLLIEKAIVMDAIKISKGAFTGDAIAMADGIATLAGGIKEFQSLFQDYYSSFYTEAEQLANTTSKLTASLADMGVTLPKTRLAYRDLVNAQDLATQKGREQYIQLLELSSAADIYYKSLEKLNDSMKLLGEENFKTAVDYQRYVSLASLAGISGASDRMTPNANTTFMPMGSSFGMNGLVDNRELIAEIKFLRAEIAKMQASGTDTSYNTKKMADLLQRVTRDGDSLLTTAA